MRTIGESAKLFDEGLIPWRFDHLDKAVFTLGHERISAVLFRALFPFSRDMVVIGFSGLFKDLRERCGISDPLIHLSGFPPRPHRSYRGSTVCPHDFSRFHAKATIAQQAANRRGTIGGFVQVSEK